MTIPPIRFAAFLGAGALAAFAAPRSESQDSRPAAGNGAPRLVVVCVFDQMREDYLDRFAAGFGDDGFRRVLRDGVRYSNCNYPYAATETGPGHASIASGRLPRHHGIVANSWYDPAAKRTQYCYGDSAAKALGPSGAIQSAGMSPKNFLGENLSDCLRNDKKNRGRVFSISQKDRATVPMGGRDPNIALWFYPSAGTFGASTYYPAGVPAWLGDFTKAHAAETLPKVWERALPAAAYGPFDPDDAAWEKGKASMGAVFPHSLLGKGSALPSWDSVNTSPVSLAMLTDLACEIVEREKVGKGEGPDLLWVSYSATDFVGHAFGPDSHELFDLYARADRELARLLAKLDAAVGPASYVLAITADHGATEVPEHAKKNGRSAGRLSFTTDGKGNAAGDLATLEGALSERLGKRPEMGKRWSRFVTQSDYHFSPDTLAALGVERADAAKALVEVLRADPRFVAAYTRETIQSQRFAADDRLARALYASYHPDRSGDVQFVIAPGWLESSSASSHGSPHASDTHVPLLIAGPGIPKNRVDPAPVTPLDLAPTLAACLRIGAPEGCDGSILPNLGIESRPASAPAPR